MIFVDSNIPMYLVGASHPLKESSRHLLEGCITRGERLVTDAEVLQEILHRYTAIGRRDAIRPAFDALLGVCDEVFPVERDDAVMASSIILDTPVLSARDAIHAAVMKRRGVSRLMSFDAGFDALPWIERLT